jgi:2,4-dienoyl-CoA reductase-like NADH-dependent reductase (Old Yellow Enzyme family)
MTNLFSQYRLKGHTIKNRVVVPPMVCFHYALDEGTVSDRNIEHYDELSKGGAGIIVTEATAVMKSGRLASFQLGLWEERQIEGMRRIAGTVKAGGALSILQIHHAGLVTPATVNNEPAGPSADPKNPASRALTLAEIGSIRDAFIAAAVRAEKAGFDGIELHGAHGYLLNQFASSLVNQRDDEYGRDFSGRMKLATEIIAGIKKVCKPEFILEYRLGANAPTLEDGILIAQYLESLGVDILSVSHGGLLINLPRPPKDFDYNWIVFCGSTIKSKVTIPVITVNEIRTAERASFLIGNGFADFVALGRPNLADPYWTSHVENHEPVNECLACKPKCRWYENSDLCPARKRLELKSQR